jgi:hypothetical protein
LSLAAGSRLGDGIPHFSWTNQVLIVDVPRLQNPTMHVFRVDLENKALHMIKSIRNRAIFLGNRSLYIHVDNLPTIKANCVYNINIAFDAKKKCGIYMHCLDNGSNKKKLVEPIDMVHHVMVCQLSLTQILMDYANYSDMTNLANNLGA